MLTFKEITDIRNNTHAVENESYEDLKKIVLLSSNSKIYDDNDVGYYDNKTRWRNKKFLETISQIYYTPSYEQLCSRDEEFLSVIKNSRLLSFNRSMASLVSLVYYGEFNIDNLINNPLYLGYSSNKLLNYMLILNKDITGEYAKYVPDTVKSVEDAEFLKYPILGKPSRGHSGVGIKKFNSYKELDAYVKEHGNTFGLFTEYRKISRELRLIMYKRKPFMLCERVAMSEDTKNMNKTAEKPMDFKYVWNDLDTLPSITLPMINFISECFKCVEFLTIDFAIDEFGEPFYIETNETPGPLMGLLSRCYLSIFYDEYHRLPDEASLKRLWDIESELIDMDVNNKSNPGKSATFEVGTGRTDFVNNKEFIPYLTI